MITVLRTMGSILAGMALALVLIIAVEVGSAVVHPFPPGFDLSSPEQMFQHVARYPQWVLFLVVIAWGYTAYLSTLLTRWIGNRGSAAFIGVLLFLAVAFNVAHLPYPLWFKIANLIAIPGVVFLVLSSPGSVRATTVRE